MSDARRKRSLMLIERLARDRAREAARTRAELEAEHARLVTERERILASMIDRPAIPEAAATPYLAGWIRSVSGQADLLSRDAAQVKDRISDAADRAAYAFRDAEAYRNLISRIDAEHAERQDAAQRDALLPYLTKT